MTARGKNTGKLLDQALGLYKNPSSAGMELAKERVLRRLESEGEGLRDEALLSEVDVPVRRLHWPIVIPACAAIIVAVLMPALMLRHVPSPALPPAVLEEATGARKIQYGQTVHSAETSGAVLVLLDQSRIEMRSQSELSLERADDGVRIRLSQGSVIVTAAKQRAGHLYVQTKDVTVSVVGTVFLVNAEEAGSRVAVIQGEVRVQQGGSSKQLLPGEQVSTNPIMPAVPVIQEIQWSRYAVQHLALLQQSIAVPPVPPAASSPVPQWEAVSIKPCSDPSAGERAPAGGRGGQNGGGGLPVSSPGRLEVKCGPFGSTVAQLIQRAYFTFANGQRNPQFANTVSVDGGPAWINSDRYEINAKAEGTPSLEMMQGPMMQAILEDRFKLKVRRETREIAVYAMTPVKSGPKLQALEDGNCDDSLDIQPRPGRMTPDEMTEFLQPGQKPRCRQIGFTSWGPGDLNWTVHVKYMTLAQFANAISRAFDRPVVDRTGVAGMFSFRLKFARDQATERLSIPFRNIPPQANLAEAPSEPAGPSIFTAMQEQLGLKLDASRGPGDFLVIDAIDRPSEN